jgi:hypothetical protein
MKNTILVLLLIFSTITTFSQEKGLLLTNSTNKKTDFLVENRRIKVFTDDGKKIAGKLKIIDENTIEINSILIPMNSIQKVRKASIFSAISTPLLVTAGSVGTILGVAGIFKNDSIGSIGYLPPSIPLAIIPLHPNKHPKEKWEYKIVFDYKKIQ